MVLVIQISSGFVVELKSISKFCQECTLAWLSSSESSSSRAIERGWFCCSPKAQFCMGWKLNLSTFFEMKVKLYAFRMSDFLCGFKVDAGGSYLCKLWAISSTWKHVTHLNEFQIFRLIFPVYQTCECLYFCIFIQIIVKVSWCFDVILFLTRMTQNWTKTITIENEDY
jgi:hypothetical protein